MTRRVLRPVSGVGVLAAIVVVLAMAAACGPKRLVLPVGPSAPAPGARAAYEEASLTCRGIRTVRTTIALSGRAGGQRMRGTLIAGLEQPEALRLEGVAPFGPPVFILAARAGAATLLLPRDNRVLTGATTADILETLAGVRLDPASLRTILTGCVVPSAEPGEGRGFEGGWMAIDLGGGATAYLHHDQARWRIVAGRLPALEVQYAEFENELPRRLQIRSRPDHPSSVPVDLTLALSDMATNITLHPAAFAVDVPADAVPMTLAELRGAGPLGVKGKREGSSRQP